MLTPLPCGPCWSLSGAASTAPWPCPGPLLRSRGFPRPVFYPLTLLSSESSRTKSRPHTDQRRPMRFAGSFPNVTQCRTVTTCTPQICATSPTLRSLSPSKAGFSGISRPARRTSLETLCVGGRMTIFVSGIMARCLHKSHGRRGRRKVDSRQLAVGSEETRLLLERGFLDPASMTLPAGADQGTTSLTAAD
jgi:hypothetical protein